MIGRVVFCWVLLSGFVDALAQVETKQAFESGFEQLFYFARGDSAWVGYEHRNFRNPAHGMLYLVQTLDASSTNSLQLVPRYHNVPLGTFDVSDRKFVPTVPTSISGNFSAGDVSGYRLHIRFSPDIQARFGNFNNPVQAKVNLLLDTKIFLGYGLALYSGVVLPIANNLDSQSKNVRPGPTQLQYFGRVGEAHFVFISAGTFFYDRYGLDLQYRKFDFTNRLSYGLEAGLTGFYFFPPEGLYTRSMNDLYALVDVEYFFPSLSSSVGLSAGQFLFKDRGLRLDFVRQYGNVDLGLFAVRTKSGTNVGFNIAFSLFPGKILRTKTIEIRTNEDFRWEYGHNNEDVVGRRYRTGVTRLKDFLRPYHSKFIAGQISSEL